MRKAGVPVRGNRGNVLGNVEVSVEVNKLVDRNNGLSNVSS